MNRPIYLDYNATTPIDPEVVKIMLPYLHGHFGNPSSTHSYGSIARNGIENARGEVARLVNCKAENIIFTSGGTESNNLAIRGAAFSYKHKGNHIITSAIEHPAVMEVCKWLVSQGFELTILPVDHRCMVNPKDLERMIRPETVLVSIMHANNETGTIQLIAELAEIAHHNGIIFHTDAAQTVGKIPVDLKYLGVDLLSIAGHKLYAPKGVGALFIQDGIHLENIMFGANHEQGIRPGTENTLEIVGLGEACKIAKRDLETLGSKYWHHRDQLLNGLINKLGAKNVRLNGHSEFCLPNTLNISFKGILASDLLAIIQNKVAASAGSACHADQVKISPVLEAMETPLEWAKGAVRFSVGRGTSNEQIKNAVDVISSAIAGCSTH